MLLPSGYRVRGVIPGLAELAHRGLLDERVQEAVFRLASSAYISEDEADHSEDARRRSLLDSLVAGFPREAQDPGGDEWLPVSLMVEDLPNLDQRDRQELEFLVLRHRTAEDISAGVEKTEGTGDLDRLAEFRDDPDRPADSPDGESLADAPVGAAAGGG